MSRCSILLFITTAGRCFEVAAFSKHPNHLKFLDSGAISLLPLLYFLAKKDQFNRFKPKIIQPFSLINPNFCPVNVIKDALYISSATSSSKILNPWNLINISVSFFCFMVWKIIRAFCPSAFPKVHYLREHQVCWKYFNRIGSYCSLLIKNR